jgi:hypothetical protein
MDSAGPAYSSSSSSSGCCRLPTARCLISSCSTTTKRRVLSSEFRVPSYELRATSYELLASTPNSFSSSLDPSTLAPKHRHSSHPLSVHRARFPLPGLPIKSPSLSSLFTDKRPFIPACPPQFPRSSRALCLPVWYRLVIYHPLVFVASSTHRSVSRRHRLLQLASFPTPSPASLGFASAIHWVPCRINVSSICASFSFASPFLSRCAFARNCYLRLYQLILLPPLRLSSLKWIHTLASLRFPQAHQTALIIVCPRSATSLMSRPSLWTLPGTPPNHLSLGFHPYHSSAT